MPACMCDPPLLLVSWVVFVPVVPNALTSEGVWPSGEKSEQQHSTAPR